MSEAETIVRALGGRWNGRRGACRCPAHDDQHPSLSVAEGDDGRLLLHCFAGCAFEEVLDVVRDMGLAEESGGRLTPDPETVERRRTEEAAERAKRTAQARRLWAEASPIAGTLDERYLRARCIRGPLLPSLRFAAHCWHQSAKRFPAMVAAVTLEGEAEPVTAHRAYLAEPGRKADVDPAKAMLGPASGGAARLAEGPGPLCIAEGVETALSLRDALRAHRPSVWAGLSAHGLSAVRLPATPGELVVAPDAGAAGWRAAEALADGAHKSGWRVKVLPPPREGDWNDRAKAAARVAA